jgi:hypothetical protein
MGIELSESVQIQTTADNIWDPASGEAGIT